MSRRLAAIGVLMGLMSAGLSVLPAGADDKPIAKESAAETNSSVRRLRISDVIVQGSEQMSPEQIKERLRTQAGKEYDPAALDEDVRELYRTRQFRNVQTLIEPDGHGKVKVYIVFRDVPNKVQKISFLGAKHIKPEDLRKETGIRIGSDFNRCLNEEGRVKIMEMYQEMGWPFASCTLVKGGDWKDTEVIYQITEGPKVKVNGNNSVEDKIKIDEARIRNYYEKKPQARVGQVFIIGNERVSDNAILELVPVFPGQNFNYSDLQKAEKNLAKTGLFVVDPATGVHPTVTVIDNDDGPFKDIRITVKKKNASGEPE